MGVIVVSAITALACGIAISMLETGIQAGEEYLQGFSGGTAAILMFSAPAGIAVIATITRLAVDLGRPAYARWQLAGVGPPQTALVVITQIIVASLLGGVIGFGATTLLAGPAIHSAFESGTGGYSEISIVTGPLTASVTIPATVVIALLGGLRAARTAGRTPPLAALREPETEAKRMRWWRWLLLLAVVAGAVAFFVSLFQTAGRGAFLSQGPLVPVIITVVLVTAGPILYPWLLNGWTALVPVRLSTSWYLARHQARYHLSRSTASITPLFTGTALLGGVAIVISAGMTATALGRFVPAVPIIDVVYALALIGVGLILTVLATVLPVAARSRTSVTRQLAAQ